MDLLGTDGINNNAKFAFAGAVADLCHTANFGGNAFGGLSRKTPVTGM